MLIADQECKMKHSTNASRLSVLAVICSVVGLCVVAPPASGAENVGQDL